MTRLGQRPRIAADLRPVVVTTADGELGLVHIAAGELGLVAAELLSTPESFREGLARRGRRSIVDLDEAAPGPARDLALLARDAFAGFLGGRAADLSDLPVDLADRPAWDRQVLGAVRSIPPGRVASYGEIARRIGHPGAARAVGGAVSRNPVALVIPCHRVIAGDGSLGGYGAAAWGGVEAALALKRALLRLEGVEVG